MALVSKNFSDIITFTRASTATYFDSTGTLQSAAIDAPRLDYNPSTLAAQGLLIEESRTNSIRNNTMQGAVAGTPGTLPTNWTASVGALTYAVVGTGTENGITYVDLRFNGTPSATTAQTLTADSLVSSIGQTWCVSAWFKLAAGTTTNINTSNFQLRVADEAAFTTVPLTSTLTRIDNVRTLTGTTAAWRIRWNYVDTVTPVDFTLRIGLPQMELGAFATSVIPTTTTALTRAADVASVNTLSPWYNSVEGTLFSETQQAQDRTGGFPVAAGISDSGSGANTIEQYWSNSTSSLGLIVYVSSSIQANLQNSGLTRTNVQKVASAYKVNDFASTVGGGTVQTDTSGTIPVVDRLTLGARPGGGSNINGYLRRITYYPRKLSSAELQAITA
jgi:hypothetical protein